MGILGSIKRHAPSVRRVVLTLSFVAVAHDAEGVSWDHIYTAEDWNPVTPEEAAKDPFIGYRGRWPCFFTCQVWEKGARLGGYV